MVDSTPDRWRPVHSHQWYDVDEVEFILMVLPNGAWDTDTIGPVEIAFEDSGWLLWRDTVADEGGAFAQNMVIHIEWAI